MHYLHLRTKIDILKSRLAKVMDKNKGDLQEEKILELSKELDVLICEYIEACK